MKVEIPNRFSGKIIVSVEAKSIKQVVIDNRANLGGADLRRADLRGADLDMSCFPLWCGSFQMKVDTRFIWQMICHLTRLDVSRCSKNTKEAIDALDRWKNEFCKYRDDVDKI